VSPAITWHPLALVNSWEGFATYGVPSYTKDAEGFVHLSGAMGRRTPEPESEVATLPEGDRPTRGPEQAVWVRAASTNGENVPKMVDLEILGNGTIIAYAGSEAEANDRWVSLEGVTFYAG
jgi:hypothetical protein